MDHALPDAPATAGDVMTEAVVTALPTTSVRDVARLLSDRRISAVPIVDAAGTLLGMASEGDLLGRGSDARLAGQEWWLAMLSKPGQAEAAVMEAAVCRPVSDVMHTPVITIAENATVQEAAALLRTHRIKRLPVVRGGRMVGIVSRADLLRAVEHLPATRGVRAMGGLAEMIGGFFAGAAAPAALPAALPSGAQAAPDPVPITAGMFRSLIQASDRGRADEAKAIAGAVELGRARQVKAMLEEHVGTGTWESLKTHAQVVAAHGGKDMQILLFPAGLCSDGARMINNADPAWAGTLRGEAAEMYARWERELKPAGFGIAARVVDYPGGTPGDVALVLVWQT